MECAKVWVGAGHFQSSKGITGITLQRMDNVLIVVDNLEAAKAFFIEIGMELEGEMSVEGRSVDLLVVCRLLLLDWQICAWPVPSRDHAPPISPMGRNINLRWRVPVG